MYDHGSVYREFWKNKDDNDDIEFAHKSRML